LHYVINDLVFGVMHYLPVTAEIWEVKANLLEGDALKLSRHTNTHSKYLTSNVAGKMTHKLLTR